MLTTERLELRPFAAEQAEALHAVFLEAEVRRYLLDDLCMEREWVDREIADSVARFAEGGLGLWAITRPGDDEIVGFVGFREFFEPPQLQLVYGLLPSTWGRGLATEAAAEAVRYAFEEGALDEIVAATDAANRASERVMLRLGMSFLEARRAAGRPTVFYRLRRARP